MNYIAWTSNKLCKAASGLLLGKEFSTFVVIRCVVLSVLWNAVIASTLMFKLRFNHKISVESPESATPVMISVEGAVKKLGKT